MSYTPNFEVCKYSANNKFINSIFFQIISDRDCIIKQSVFPSGIGETAITQHETVIAHADFRILEIVMDSDYTLFFCKHRRDQYSIQVRSSRAFQLLNTILLDNGTYLVLRNYFHYLNGLIVIYIEDSVKGNWIRFTF